ncbi:MAG TPA: 16S rRNA (cytosine(1402)-N(4))-methyltransferase RsmH [Candidatus Binatia bacterium]|nr:16S rRNA (cytosine(1402)-N(4))-methyltransferase RsmH [Candidatus Binatia bacterium]
MEYAHAPVLLDEVTEILEPRAQGKYLDGTLGGGGHSEKILERSEPDGELLGLDWDEEALAAAEKRLARFGPRAVLRRANFKDAAAALSEIGWERVNGAVLDLGISSRHVDAPERGFSFQMDGPLDMRMDRRRPLDAATIVNTYPADELARILRKYGEEPRARRIAAAIDRERRRGRIETTRQLADLVARSIGGKRGHIHPATKTFQALRIAVNGELQNLEAFLETGYELLHPRGRLAIISFHSLEDRMVKQAFRKWSRSCLCPPRTPVCRCGWSQKVKLLTPRPRVPSETEAGRNPRARSAKLRAVERL